jgi:outer membrane protein TolC
MRNVLRFVCATLVAACAAAPVSAQVLAPRGPLGETGPFSGGVPTGQRSDQPLPLTLADAISRGLEHNLGVIARREDVEQARSERWRALSAVLPNVSGRLSADREVINLAALGFTGFPGIPSVIGPFNVFDARIGVSQPVIDPQGLFHLRETNHELTAARHNFRNARDLVVVAVTNLYLQVLATDSRVAAVRAELETADALATLAEDRRKAGLVPAIDANRAQVQRQNAQQRLITSENAAARQKLVLARAIGLPLGQTNSLTDPMPISNTQRCVRRGADA